MGAWERRLVLSVLVMASGDGEYGFRLYCLSLTCFFKAYMCVCVYIYVLLLEKVILFLGYLCFGKILV